MPRRYRRSGSSSRRASYARAVSGRSKYSIETTTSNQIISAMTSDGGTRLGQAEVVKPVDLQGMRKVKHMQISVCLQHAGTATAAAAGAPILWVLAYVPQGQTTIMAPSTSGSVYEPNQFVIASGLSDADAGPIRINTPLARNLNSGDKIVLVYRLLNGDAILASDTAASILTMVRYAITLN